MHVNTFNVIACARSVFINDNMDNKAALPCDNFQSFYYTVTTKNCQSPGPIACVIVLASRASGPHLDTQNLKNHLSGHPKMFFKNV